MRPPFRLTQHRCSTPTVHFLPVALYIKRRSGRQFWIGKKPEKETLFPFFKNMSSGCCRARTAMTYIKSPSDSRKVETVQIFPFRPLCSTYLQTDSVNGREDYFVGFFNPFPVFFSLSSSLLRRKNNFHRLACFMDPIRRSRNNVNCLLNGENGLAVCLVK